MKGWITCFAAMGSSGNTTSPSDSRPAPGDPDEFFLLLSLRLLLLRDWGSLKGSDLVRAPLSAIFNVAATTTFTNMERSREQSPKREASCAHATCARDSACHAWSLPGSSACPLHAVNDERHLLLESSAKLFCT